MCVFVCRAYAFTLCIFRFLILSFFFSFFFFKQKTAYEMRISDWSSDVCSSDLHKRLFSSASSLTSEPPDFLRNERHCRLWRAAPPRRGRSSSHPDRKSVV